MIKYDQHFMIDEELIKRIVSYLDIQQNESVIEIGAGNGALSSELYTKTKNLNLVEIDKELISGLKEKFKDVKILNKNVLNMELKYDKIVGNIPYNISEPLFNKLLKSNFKKAIFTVPNNFLISPLLNKLMNTFFKIETLEIVDKDKFKPKPRVLSKVISVEHKKLNDNERILKEVYINQTKKLMNAFEDAYFHVLKLSKKQTKEKIPAFEFLEKRVYMLNTKEMSKIVEFLNI
ncbi:methyltransferase [Candidatus Woesearchaeota archaeon]|nr:methyltransferase [Candidatus Woesearchaeota archaeon]